MDKQEVQLIAFNLIGYSGEAFNHFFQAIEYAREKDFISSDEELKLGEEKLAIAHKSQTSMLVAESRNQEVELSVILIHAQDHLMTTIMFERIAKEFINIYKER